MSGSNASENFCHRASQTHGIFWHIQDALHTLPLQPFYMSNLTKESCACCQFGLPVYFGWPCYPRTCSGQRLETFQNDRLPLTTQSLLQATIPPCHCRVLLPSTAPGCMLPPLPPLPLITTPCPQWQQEGRIGNAGCLGGAARSMWP